MKLQGSIKQATKAPKVKGFVVFEGLSRFDKKSIVGIVTLETTNAKTGNMAQLWILRSDIAPHDAVKTGDDMSICGGCVHRHNTGGSCYVLPFQGPLSVYRSYQKGNYPTLSLDDQRSLLTSKGLRFGAYGDPAMLPIDVIAQLHSMASFTTGYTHQWKNKRLQDTLEFVQASVDNVQEYHEVKTIRPQSKSFRVVKHQTDLMPDEIECLSDSQGLSCADCRLCNGNRKDIAIMVHGNKASKFTADIQAINL